LDFDSIVVQFAVALGVGLLIAEAAAAASDSVIDYVVTFIRATVTGF
jgi:hypothetical protein